MQSTMGRGLAAGIALILFSLALVTFSFNADRVAGAAALAGLVALSIALLAHVVERPTR